MQLAIDSTVQQQELNSDSHLQKEALDLSVEEATVTDIDDFIKQAFDSDPRYGCELLFRHYYLPLCSHAIRFLYSKTIAEDLVSEIFLQFYQKQTYLHITPGYRAYLYKAVRNSAYNYLRWEAKRSADLENCVDFSDLVCQQPDALIQYEELYQQVAAAINSLPPQRRKVYLMHRFEGKKYAEIAQELQLSSRTVEVQIRKASHFLREILRHKNVLMLTIFSSAVAQALPCSFRSFIPGILFF
jgi:RNA polymerase sigma-70 factor (ECF subfamily)